MTLRYKWSHSTQQQSCRTHHYYLLKILPKKYSLLCSRVIVMLGRRVQSTLLRLMDFSVSTPVFLKTNARIVFRLCGIAEVVILCWSGDDFCACHYLLHSVSHLLSPILCGSVVSVSETPQTRFLPLLSFANCSILHFLIKKWLVSLPHEKSTE